MAVGQNTIQLKRSTITGRTPNTTSSSNTQYINAGELALNMTDGVLYSSTGSTLITIGSNLTSLSVTGIATVANVFTVGNSTVNTFANSTHFYSGNATYYGYGNSTFDVLVNPTGNLSMSPVSITLSNSTAAVLTANLTQLTIGNTGSMLIGNTTVNTYVVPASISINGTTWVANTTGAYHTGTINASSFTTTGVTANVTGIFLANTASLVVGNATVNTVISQGVINTTSVVNAASYTIGTTLIGNTTGIYHTGTMNAASFTTTSVTANVTGIFLANTAQFYAGNATINTSITSYSATFGTNTVTVGTATYFVSNGNVGIGNTAPNAKLQVSGTANISGVTTFGANVSGSNTYANCTAITGGSSSITTLDGFFIDCGIYS